MTSVSPLSSSLARVPSLETAWPKIKTEARFSTRHRSSPFTEVLRTCVRSPFRSLGLSVAPVRIRNVA